MATEREISRKEKVEAEEVLKSQLKKLQLITLLTIVFVCANWDACKISYVK